MAGSTPPPTMQTLLSLTYLAVIYSLLLTLTTGGRVIAAKITESIKAKADYAMAKAEKKTAALLE